jgi:1-acyl-sn-glycerol-3-phosphate acyltransferase
MGAFVAAVESGMPVVPIAIRGTRFKMRSETWFPRKGPVTITIGKPLTPHGTDWNAALKLRNQVREDIVRNCGEPDLGPGPQTLEE